jgi:hypothetical protein
MMEEADSSETTEHFYHTTWHHTAQDNNLRLQISHITDALVSNDTTDWSNTNICKNLELFEGNCHNTVTEENAKYACATFQVHRIRVHKGPCLGEESEGMKSLG